jgi:hypothetical protein
MTDGLLWASQDASSSVANADATARSAIGLMMWFARHIMPRKEVIG